MSIAMHPHAQPQAPSRSQLLRDHAALDGLFDTVLSAFTAGDRRQLAAIWTTFESRVLAHLDREERTAFPSLALAEPLLAEHLLAEHRSLRTALAELAIGTDLHLVRLDVVQELVLRLRAHMARENAAMYRCAAED